MRATGNGIIIVIEQITCACLYTDIGLCKQVAYLRINGRIGRHISNNKKGLAQ